MCIYWALQNFSNFGIKLDLVSLSTCFTLYIDFPVVLAHSNLVKSSFTKIKRDPTQSHTEIGSNLKQVVGGISGISRLSLCLPLKLKKTYRMVNSLWHPGMCWRKVWEWMATFMSISNTGGIIVKNMLRCWKDNKNFNRILKYLSIMANFYSLTVIIKFVLG